MSALFCLFLCFRSYPEKVEEYIPTFYKIRYILEELYVAVIWIISRLIICIDQLNAAHVSYLDLQNRWNQQTLPFKKGSNGRKSKAALTIDLKKILKERLLSRLTTRLLLIREKEVNFNFPLSLLTAVVSSFSFCLISSWPTMGSNTFWRSILISMLLHFYSLVLIF